MKITRVTAMYFSATGKTKMMTLDVASMLAMKLAVPLGVIDFSRPDARDKIYEFGSEEAVVIGVPVYAGRVPNLLLPFLKEKVKGAGACESKCGCDCESEKNECESNCECGCESKNCEKENTLGTPCIPIVTFGNRSYDNALIELRNIMTENGFAAIGAGAFCAQHSFSNVLGAGRPDGEDLFKADELAIVFSERLEKLGLGACASSCNADEKRRVINGIEIPVHVKGDKDAGYYKPRDREGNPIDIRKVKPKTSAACTNCGICADICPMGAIDHSDFSNVNGICIKCCACERSCPVSAKYFDDPGYLYHKEELEIMYGDVRAESEIF